VTPLIPGMIFQGPLLNNRETGVVILQHTHIGSGTRSSIHTSSAFPIPGTIIVAIDVDVNDDIGTLDVTMSLMMKSRVDRDYSIFIANPVASGCTRS
jgi:hypothetical protein